MPTIDLRSDASASGPYEIAMIAPRVDGMMSMPPEYHTTVVMDPTSRESQVASLGEGMLSAVELARTHPNFSLFPHLHYAVMFCTVDSLEE